MNIEIKQTNSGHDLVQIEGELRGDDALEVREQLHELIAEQGAAMVVDISQVPLIDSSGLSQLINLVTHARLSQSRVVLVGPTPFVAGVLNLAKLDKWFEIAGSVEEADRMLAE